MAAQTPIFTLEIEFDEDALQRVLRASDTAQKTDAQRNHAHKLLHEAALLVPLKCTLRSADGQVCHTFVIDAAHLPRSRLTNVEENDCGERTFYYLNGLLNALQRVRLWRGAPVRALKVATSVRFLQQNASARRIGHWKKRGFKRADGEGNIRFRGLWNEFYSWCTSKIGFHPLQVSCL